MAWLYPFFPFLFLKYTVGLEEKEMLALLLILRPSQADGIIEITAGQYRAIRKGESPAVVQTR